MAIGVEHNMGHNNPYACFFGLKNRKVTQKSRLPINIHKLQEDDADDESLVREVIVISSSSGSSSEESAKRRKTSSSSSSSWRNCCEYGSVRDFYENLQQIGKGSYGAVFKAKDKRTGEIVALKKEMAGFDHYTSSREIEILGSFRGCHPSIVGLKRVILDERNDVYVAMEYLEYDLNKYIRQAVEVNDPLRLSEVKWFMKQLLQGVKFLHKNKVMHRDLKPSNILLNRFGDLKICDFGLSMKFTRTDNTYTARVGTRGYKAPEILLGATKYTCAVDMWSVGCIMAEMILGKPLFRSRGNTQIAQMDKIFGILGTPNDYVWPGFSSLPGVSGVTFVQQHFSTLRHRFADTGLSDLGFDLLYRLLAYDPEKRISAEAALNHDWFKQEDLI